MSALGLRMLLTLALSQGGAPQFYSASEAQGLFAEGLSAYDRQDYATAEDRFRRLVDHGFGSSEVLYNLGSAHLAEGELGEAVLFLERARRVGGSSGDDVEAQLAIARAKQLDQVTGAPTEISLSQRLVEATSVRWAGYIFLGSWLFAFTLLCLHRFSTRLRLSRRSRAGLLAPALLSLVVALPTGALLGLHAAIRSSVREAVILSKVLPARESPSHEGRVKFELHGGLKVRLLDREGEFVRLRLPNGLEGWVEEKGVASI